MSVPRGKATFGSLLREHRLAAGLTQEALSERSGVSPRTIQEIEAGSAEQAVTRVKAFLKPIREALDA